jgi:hypothetical protein
MATLTELREELASVISDATGIQAVANLPERPVPPIALVSGASPYITYDQSATWGELVVQLRVDLVMSVGANSVEADRLDEVIEDALVGAIAAGWLVNEVSAPYQLTANAANYLAVTMTCAKHNNFY